MTGLATLSNSVLSGRALSDGVLLAGAAAVAGVRATAAVTEGALRAGDWPLWRCGPAAAGLVAHDVALGLIGYGFLAAGPALLVRDGWGAGLPDGVALTGFAAVVVGVLLLTGAVLRRRRALPLTRPGRGGTIPEPRPTLRARLLSHIELVAVRATSAWIGRRLELCRRHASASDEQLLPAVWAPARMRLRETVGVGRTEVALLLVQAQTVMDDGSPPAERLRTLLQLVLERSGRRGVQRVLDQAGRAPLRHGRTGAPGWGATSAPGIAPAVPPMRDPVEVA